MNSNFDIQTKLNNKLTSSLFFSLIVTILIHFFTENYFYSSVGIGLTIYILLRLLILVDYRIPVIEIMLFIAAMQWIIGPYIDYQNQVKHYKMYMYVDELQYMNITVPLFLSFLIASILFTPNINRYIDKDKLNSFFQLNKKLPFVIIGIGLLTKLLLPIVPSSLAFVTFLATNLSIVGLGALYFSNHSFKVKVFGSLIVLFPLFFEAVRSGLFHHLIISSIFIFIFINITYQFSFIQKILLLTSALFILSVIQLIKAEYRKTISNPNYRGDKIELFFDLLLNNNNIEELNDDEEQNNINARLNQGWIISRIYSRIPEYQDFKKGKTIIDAIQVSLVPRFLSPNKKGGGGKETFEELTGFKLIKGTSMGASLLGEFYGNYGVFGGAISFFLWGIFLNLVLLVIQILNRINPIVILFLPIIFLQVIKAESDLTTVLNHIVKSSIFTLLVVYFINSVNNK